MASKLPVAGASGEGDIKYIRELIHATTKDLANDLVEQSICADWQSIETAEDILFKGSDIQSNYGIKDAKRAIDDGFQKIADKIQRYRKKIPSFLLISAPVDAPGSRRRRNEEKQRESEGRNFTKLYDMDSDKYRTIKVVDNYQGMLDEIKAFVSDTGLSELPFVVFLGHGSERGELCFHQGEWIDCGKALDDVHKCFKENRPRKMPSWQLRFVFAQCYGHLVDGHDVPGTRQSRGVEYVYITSSSHESSVSVVESCAPPKISCLYHMSHKRDVHLKLSAGHIAMEDAASDLQQMFPQYAAQECKPEIKQWLLEGPTLTLPPEVQQAVQERRKTMVRFLLLGCADSASYVPNFDVFGEFIDPLYERDAALVTSQAQLYDAVTNFLSGAAKDVDMPVILVAGKGKKQGDQLILELNETDPTFADVVYKRYRHVDQLRMVLCCYNNGSAGDGGEIWFSNALPPTTVDSKNEDLTKYHCAIIQDGPKNKNIQLP